MSEHSQPARWNRLKGTLLRLDGHRRPDGNDDYDYFGPRDIPEVLIAETIERMEQESLDLEASMKLVWEWFLALSFLGADFDFFQLQRQAQINEEVLVFAAV